MLMQTSARESTGLQKVRVKPYTQGDLDSLCAVYTIINAIRALCPEVTERISETLFRRLMRSLAKHTKSALMEVILGTDPGQLRKLLDEAVLYVRTRLKIELIVERCGPMLRTRSLSVAWTQLERMLDSASVMILPLAGRCAHWTVLYDVKPKKLRLIDSFYRQRLKKACCTLSRTRTRYRLELSGVIAIRRAPAPFHVRRR